MGTQSLRKSMRRGFCSLVLLLLSTAGLIAGLGTAETVNGTSARISFVGKNAVATANGVFHDWRIVENNVDLAGLTDGYVVVEIDVASLDTDNKRRDNHLRTADFFEVERWPKARVRVHSARVVEGDRYHAEFDLEIRDVRKTVSGEFEILSRAPLTIRGDLSIDRTDFGVGEPKNWNPMSITNEIQIRFEATLPN